MPEWKLDGVDLLPYVAGKKAGVPHEALYWRFGQQIAIRMGDWKLVKGIGSKGVEGIERFGKAGTADAELYNLAQDTGEKNNLAGKEPARLKELAAAWEKWNSELVDPKWIPNRPAAKKAKPGVVKRARAAAGGGASAVRFKQLDPNGDGKLSRDDPRRRGTYQN